MLALPLPLSRLLLFELSAWLVLLFFSLLTLFAPKKDGMALLAGRRLLFVLSRVLDGPAEGARVTNASIWQSYSFKLLMALKVSYWQWNEAQRWQPAQTIYARSTKRLSDRLDVHTSISILLLGDLLHCRSPLHQRPRGMASCGLP